VPAGFERRAGLGSILEGSGLGLGDRGAEPLPAGFKKRVGKRPIYFR